MSKLKLKGRIEMPGTFGDSSTISIGDNRLGAISGCTFTIDQSRKNITLTFLDELITKELSKLKERYPNDSSLELLKRSILCPI